MDFADELLRSLKNGGTLQYRQEWWSGEFSRDHYPIFFYEDPLPRTRTHTVAGENISDTQYKVGIEPTVTPRQQDEAPE
jgi:hypothetical protein